MKYRLNQDYKAGDQQFVVGQIVDGTLGQKPDAGGTMVQYLIIPVPEGRAGTDGTGMYMIPTMVLEKYVETTFKTKDEYGDLINSVHGWKFAGAALVGAFVVLIVLGLTGRI